MEHPVEVFFGDFLVDHENIVPTPLGSFFFQAWPRLGGKNIHQGRPDRFGQLSHAVFN